MPKAALIVTPVSASTALSVKSDSHPLISIALFSGIGLLVSLVAGLSDVSGAWY